ncbi:hypothetical protein ANN_06907 [Periplaneta americana]|uniref:Uncharacterized protein n=1 Tax=Periplaneta americana TaxID=6978 RepID=A0ABQ8TET3_PERAM|nr:hypothetical protein ANN_06907 [Periplaneta americana]
MPIEKKKKKKKKGCICKRKSTGRLSTGEEKWKRIVRAGLAWLRLGAWKGNKIVNEKGERLCPLCGEGLLEKYFTAVCRIGTYPEKISTTLDAKSE